jgi:hypothetical protein
MDAKKLEAARRAKDRVAASLPKGVEVVGVGIGMSGSDPALKINLGCAPAKQTVLPKMIDGVPVIYDVVGKIRARRI